MGVPLGHSSGGSGGGNGGGYDVLDSLFASPELRGFLNVAPPAPPLRFPPTPYLRSVRPISGVERLAGSNGYGDVYKTIRVRFSQDAVLELVSNRNLDV